MSRPSQNTSPLPLEWKRCTTRPDRSYTSPFSAWETSTLAAYNAGEAAVIKYGRRIPPYRETAAYVPKVVGFYEKFRLLM